MFDPSQTRNTKGIDGQYIKYDPVTDAFKIASKVGTITVQLCVGWHSREYLQLCAFFWADLLQVGTERSIKILFIPI